MIVNTKSNTIKLKRGCTIGKIDPVLEQHLVTVEELTGYKEKYGVKR